MTDNPQTTDSILTIQRTFRAPIDRVWRAFTEASELEAWFVPEGMTATVVANELKPNGVMAIHWTDGENTIENEGYFVEVLEHERIVTGEEIPEGELTLTYEFREVEDGTEVTIVQEFPDGVPDGANAGWSGMLDNLSERLDRE